MGRRLPTLLLLVAIGAALTVLTSWAFALFGRFRTGDLVAEYDKPNTAVPSDLVPEGWNVRTWHWWSGWGIRRDLVSEAMWMGSTLGLTVGGGRQWTVIHVSTGWPLKAMTWWNYHSDAPDVKAGRLRHAWWMGVDIGMKAPLPGPHGRWGVDPRLPLRPLLAGFAVNTLVYAAIAGVAGAAAGAWRRRRRRRRGLCERCAYDRRGVDPGKPCPECGCAGSVRSPA